MKLSASILCCLVLMLLSSPALTAQESGKPRFSKGDLVDNIVSRYMNRNQLVGVAVGIIRDGEVVYTKGYGFEDREKGTPATNETMFRWASISKPVTAVAAMQLVQQGKLNLDDDVRKYVPEYPDSGHLIRVRDLMCHQSGIVHYTNGRVVRTRRKYESANPFEDVILALDRFKDSPLVHPPGEKYSYSTHAYILLSAIVQRAGDDKFADQVNDRICKPLGLTTLQPDYQWIEIPNRAIGYRHSRRNDSVVPSTNTDVSWKLGGGGFVSNVQDLAGFAAGMLGNDLLNEATRRMMFEPQVLNDGSQTELGLGVFVKGDSVSHNGSQEKTRTRMAISIRDKSGIVIMSNSEYAKVGELMTQISNGLTKD